MARVFKAVGRGGVWSSYAKDLRNLACLRYANEFHKVARKAGSPLVRAFLLGHAIELYLKAFLFAHGYGETRLKDRQFGHNLKRLLDEGLANGLDSMVHISQAAKTDVEAFSKAYASKALQYFSIMYLVLAPAVPNLKRLFKFAGALQTGLAKVVREPS
jgi:hypothetical protein